MSNPNPPAPALSSEPRRWTARAAEILSRSWLRCLLLLLIGIAVRLPGLQGQLIWDDQYLAHDNPFIKSPLLTLESFRHYLFLDSYSGHYRPVQNISYIIDYLFWNTDTTGFHLSNILWHVGSAMLLYLLLRRLLPQLTNRSVTAEPLTEPTATRCDLTSTAAFFLALIWLVHPVHSAAIDYISGRADSLAFFFACGAWLLYLRANDCTLRVSRVTCYVVAFLSMLLAVCSRESGCIWLAVFLLHLLVFEQRRSRRGKVAVIVACVCVLLAYAGLRQLPGARAETAGASSWTPPTRAVLMLRALGDYGRLMIFPTNLHMERNVFDPAPLRNNASWRAASTVEYLSVAGVLVLAAFVAGAFWRGRGQRVRILGVSWFVLTYLPTSNLFDLNATVAEHWLYLPSVGFLIFATGCVLDLPARWRQAAAAFACIAVVALGARSAVRSSDWVNSETFFRRTLAAGGSSCRIAVNLALIYSHRGDYAKAESILRRVLELTPDYVIAQNNLADALFHEGKKEEAEKLFERARLESTAAAKEYPRTWLSALNVAEVKTANNDVAGAISVLEDARRQYPGTWELISFEAELLRKSPGPSAAIAIVEEFAKQNWWHAGAALALGRLYAEKGDVQSAEASLRHASWLDVHDAQALNLLARIRFRENRFADAWKVQRRAVARQPDEPRQYLLLSQILSRMGRDAEAHEAAVEVSRLQAMANAAPAAN